MAILTPQVTAVTQTSACTAHIAGQVYDCVLGRSGVVTTFHKKEGDGATPAGSYALGGEVWYRADRIHTQAIKTVLPKKIIQRNDAWSDDKKKSDYNQHVKLPYAGSHEKLWLRDNHHDYDILMVVTYNMHPTIPGKGSAIFLHIASKNEKGQLIPTSGCIAFAKKDFLKILRLIGPDTSIHIGLNGKVIFSHPKRT